MHENLFLGLLLPRSNDCMAINCETRIKIRDKMLIAGVDEVGRGPLAGPVVTAAVILNKPIRGIKDSKMLSAIKRKELAAKILDNALCFAYGRAEVSEIDSLNIHFATLLAMQRAIEALPIVPGEVLIDGNYLPTISISGRAIVKGDTFIKEISAASILAKVKRDAEMEAMEHLYPGYNFAKHKGYATKNHQQALKALGPSAIHRKNFVTTYLSNIPQHSIF